ncbi:MAG: photosystem reaction center subunit H [Rubrivivax sp. SCN 70-15]|nr:MAG: photosystem reaction center subunit H [Rubrivivax sp. SCN 70-15]
MLRTLKDLEKCTISAIDGDIGQVKDFYFDDQAWVIRYLVVDTGSWLSRRKVLISPISIQRPDWAGHRLPVGITKEQVRNSPDIDTDQPVSRQHEVQYLGYYGYANYWGGAGLWGGGMVPFAMYPGYAGLPGERSEPGGVNADIEQAERARHRDDDPHLRSCKAVLGYRIQATDGEVGHVAGLLVDDETWAVRYFVVETGHWWAGHQVLIAPQWIAGLHWSDETVAVEMSREAVRSAPPYDPAATLDRSAESGLYAHHGRPPYWKADDPARERRT